MMRGRMGRGRKRNKNKNLLIEPEARLIEKHIIGGYSYNRWAHT